LCEQKNPEHSSLLEIKTNINRRKSERIDYPFKMQHAPYIFPGINNAELIPGEILNISACGLLFKSSVSYKIGNLARLEIRIGSWNNFKPGFNFYGNGYKSEPFIVLGKVIRIYEIYDNFEKYFKIALNYISVDEGHKHAVDEFIKKLIQKKVKYENTCS
jgi:hypothetical protein